MVQIQQQLRCLVGLACLILQVFSCTTNDSLVNGPNGVDNSSMTSSGDWLSPPISVAASYLGILHMQPYFAADGIKYSAWCPARSTTTEYLQVEFAGLETVTAVLTQGRAQSTRYPGIEVYTKSYLVRYSNDGIAWNDVMESNAPKIFPGNTDRDTVVMNYLPSPMTTKYVRIVPQSWETFACMRIDILECDASAAEPVSVTSSRNSTLWGYAGVATGGVPTTNITVNTTTRSSVECVALCTTTEQCLIVSFEKATYLCIGYETTHVIGSFTPSDPSVMSPDVYTTLYFNYGTVLQ